MLRRRAWIEEPMLVMEAEPLFEARPDPLASPATYVSESDFVVPIDGGCILHRFQ